MKTFWFDYTDIEKKLPDIRDAILKNLENGGRYIVYVGSEPPAGRPAVDLIGLYPLIQPTLEEIAHQHGDRFYIHVPHPNLLHKEKNTVVVQMDWREPKSF